jgi:5'-nucleotidase
MKPLLLVTNDDGIKAPGIRELVNCLEPYYQLIVVAPKHQQSGKGLSITLNDPLQVERFNFKEGVEAYCVNGTPADCIKLATSIILKERPALIVSGINDGDNSGRNALYSGTVGAAIEATMRGLPGIAFSCVDSTVHRFDEFGHFIPKIVEHFLAHPLPQGTALNVNCPLKALGPIKGVKLAKQGMSYWTENFEKLQSSPLFDFDHYLGASWVDVEEDHDSDIALLNQGFITAVPIKAVQITDHAHFENHRAILDSSFKI